MAFATAPENVQDRFYSSVDPKRDPDLVSDYRGDGAAVRFKGAERASNDDYSFKFESGKSSFTFQVVRAGEKVKIKLGTSESDELEIDPEPGIQRALASGDANRVLNAAIRIYSRVAQRIFNDVFRELGEAGIEDPGPKGSIQLRALSDRAHLTKTIVNWIDSKNDPPANRIRTERGYGEGNFSFTYKGCRIKGNTFHFRIEEFRMPENKLPVTYMHCHGGPIYYLLDEFELYVTLEGDKIKLKVETPDWGHPRILWNEYDRISFSTSVGATPQLKEAAQKKDKKEVFRLALQELAKVARDQAPKMLESAATEGNYCESIRKEFRQNIALRYEVPEMILQALPHIRTL